MEIGINRGNLVITADNVMIAEDIEERTYRKDENGKTIFDLNPKRDVKTEFLVQFSTVLDDLIYYRVKEYDSSELIRNLFNKLPSNIANDLSLELHKKYEIEEEDDE